MNHEDLSRGQRRLYADAAQQTPNPPDQGQFEKLAQEEHSHYLILNNAE
jgi:hypothetical protein